MTTQPRHVFHVLTYVWLTLCVAVLTPSTAEAQIQTFTNRAAWEAAVAAAGASVQPFNFTGLGLVPPPDSSGANRVTQLDTNYAGRFRIVVDAVGTSGFNNPGLDIFPDASCSLGSGDCNVFTFNMFDPTSTFSGPKVNRLILPTPMVAFGGDFVQVGVAPGSGVTGPVTMKFGTESVVLNAFLDANGFGFFGIVADIPASTIEFTFAKSSTLQNDIFQIYNPAQAAGPAGPGPTYGTAVRAATRDEFGNERNRIAGDVDVEKSAWWIFSSRGEQAAHAQLGADCQALPQWSKDCLNAGAWSSSYTGASRGIAFRSFRFNGTAPTTGRVNAVLDGKFRGAPYGLPNGFLWVGGAVRVFNAQALGEQLDQSGVSASQYLLGSYSVTGGLDLEEILADTSQLLNASLLASGSSFMRNTETGPGELQTLNVATTSMTFQPGEIYTVMMDVATSSTAEIFGAQTGWGSVNFLSTLAPAPAFFTDDAGNALAGFEAVNAVSSTSPAITTLALAPGNATGLLDTEHTVTATVTDANAAPVSDAFVHFEVTSGPNTGVLGIGASDLAGQATFSYKGIGGTGTDVIVATVGSLQSEPVQKTWTPPGELDHIVISPNTASLATGASQTFSTEAFDRFNFSRGDVSATTTLSIAPDGSCAGATCTASVPGPHTVAATHQGKTDQATLTFTGTTSYSFAGFFAPIDNLPVVNASKAGSSVPVKFTLNGNQGLEIFAPGYPASQPVVCTSGTIEDQVEQVAVAGASGLVYDPVSDQYSYVWKSEKAWAGKCRQLVVKLKDGSVHTALFRFR